MGCGDGESHVMNSSINPAVKWANQCPWIDPMTVAPTEVAVGSAILLSIDAFDPDELPQPLEFGWRASNGWGAMGKSAEFPCVEVGAFTVFATVSDGDARCSLSSSNDTSQDSCASVQLRCTESTSL
jgi:hypothetical protein